MLIEIKANFTPTSNHAKLFERTPSEKISLLKLERRQIRELEMRSMEVFCSILEMKCQPRLLTKCTPFLLRAERFLDLMHFYKYFYHQSINQIDRSYCYLYLGPTPAPDSPDMSRNVIEPQEPGNNNNIVGQVAHH